MTGSDDDNLPLLSCRTKLGSFITTDKKKANPLILIPTLTSSHTLQHQPRNKVISLRAKRFSNRKTLELMLASLPIIIQQRQLIRVAESLPLLPIAFTGNVQILVS